MRLQYIYILLGTVTLLLNLALTLHLFRGGSCRKQKDDYLDNELITFRLAREHKAERLTTEAVRYDETLLLEDEP